jgi:hypothetical protein
MSKHEHRQAQEASRESYLIRVNVYNRVNYFIEGIRSFAPSLVTRNQ